MISRLVGTGIVLLAFGCKTSGTSTVKETNSTQANSNDAETAELVKGNNTFALDIYKKASKDKENSFMAPYSISSALAMTYGGAQQATAQQMESVLHFTSKQDVHGQFATLNSNLVAKEKNDGYILAIANRLWSEQTLKFEPPYQSLMDKNYGAGLQPMNFRKDFESARQTINTWVENKTNDRIKDLIAPGVLNAATSLVLTNAVYFKAEWVEENKFSEDMTRENGQFFLNAKDKIQTPMMFNPETVGLYYEDKALDVKAVSLPYKSLRSGKSASMLILLPNAIDGLANLKQKITYPDLERIIQNMRGEEIVLTLPKWKLEQSFELGPILKSMGMPDAFDDKKANFRAMAQMDPKENLYISNVIHKTYIEVQEGGTEAAGATAVVVMVMAGALPNGPQPVVFSADHPFLYFIRDNQNGAILFAGHLVKP